MGIGEILNTLIGTFVGAGLAFWSSLYLYNRRYNIEVEGSATILYADIEKSIETLNFAYAHSELEDKGVGADRLSVDIDSSRDLIIDLRNKLSSIYIKELINYCNNLELLECHRVKYWSTRTNREYESYKTVLDKVYNQSTQKEFTEAFKKVKKYSAFKNDN